MDVAITEDVDIKKVKQVDLLKNEVSENDVSENEVSENGQKEESCRLPRVAGRSSSW